MDGPWRRGRGQPNGHPNGGPARGRGHQGPGRGFGRGGERGGGRGYGRDNNNRGEQHNNWGRGGRGRGGGEGAGGGGGGRHDARPPQEPRQIREMTYNRLLELTNKEPAEVLITLRDGNCGFLEMVNALRIGSDVLMIIVRVIASACKSTLHRQNLMAFMVDMLNSKLVSEHLPKYLNRVPYLEGIDSKLMFLQHMATPLKNFLKAALISAPTLANEKLELCVTSFQTSLGTVLQQLPSTTSNDYKDLLEDMESMRKRILQPYEEAEKKVSHREFIEAGEPPQNFREVEIAPTTAELRGDVDPFLRENIVSGRYRDGEHYLDVQFRLLREDFVGPLREGITKYRELVGAASAGGAAAKALKAMKDLRIYRRVKIQTQESTGSGMVFVLQLDIAVLNNIKWENSKRLLTGSLLCMSHDDFASIALAIVVRRDLTKLKKGLLTVQIIEGRAIVDAPNARGLEFVLAESPAYFEAFSPILKGLQALEGDKLPFSKYIIEINTNMSPPKYARRDMRYDLSPLLCGFKDEHQKMMALSQPKWVPILHDDLWPSKDDFGLDVSQFKALQGALTRELAIIQGPPGTGKTFLGLKVVEALLHNQTVWKQRVAPILTICFTNHALDQFLEGILEQVGNKGIVRVGGRSRSEKLEPYNLMALRQKEENLRTIPRHIHQTSKHIRWRMRQVGHDMAILGTMLNMFRQKVINEQDLRQFMTDDHHRQFSFLRRRAHAKFGIQVWLGGAVTQADLAMVDQEMHPLDAAAERMAANNPVVEEEEDEDFDENQRILDEEDNFYDMFGRVHIRDDFDDEDDDVPGMQVVYGGGWQVQGGQKAFKKILKRQMNSMDAMTEQEVERVKNVDYLMPRDRWRLYRYWVFQMRDAHQTRLEILQRDYEGIYRELREVEMEENTHIIRNATVVGMTTTGAAKYQTVLQEIKPQIVIVEEAAEVFEAHIITALTKDCDHLVLIGDHQQLRPNPTVYKLANRYNLDVSLFERMIKNGIPFESLKLQHRMRPQIARLLVPNIYKELLNHPSVEGRPQIKGVGHNLYFISHSIRERDASDSTSKENLFEADYAAALCRHFILQGYEGEKITVLTTYVGQMFQLKNRMKHPLYAGVRITVVDNYQGEENDIIILSLVRSNTESKIGFLKVENRVCVALSRARDGLFAIGNFDFLVENGGQVWNPIVGHLTRAELIGPTLRLVCQNHSDIVVEAKSAADFQKAPEGGCSRPCEVRLPCGHQCSLVCHNYDPEHTTEKTRCSKPCVKIICERGHNCKRMCFEDCGKCNVQVDVVIPRCGHLAKARCSEDPEKVRCNEKCNKYRRCGHKCPGNCHEICPGLCYTPVAVNGPCGHVVNMPCCKKDDMKLAKERCIEHCTTTLDCEHKCRGACGGCYQGRFHMRCTEKCGRILVCGHDCTVPCAVTCPPCTRKCENRCIHSKCPNICGVPCKPCVEKCPWQCAHHQCTQPCWKECDRPPCQEPCPLTLACGHGCIGMCGEPCPKKCRVCDRDEVCEIFFGDEDDEVARFVELEDCGHVIEVNAMDHWMDGDKEEEEPEEINMKGCPKCKTVIRQSLRYGSQVKRTLNDVVKIKERVFGQKQNKTTLIIQIQKTKLQLHVLAKMLLDKIEESIQKSAISSSEYSLLENLVKLADNMREIHVKAVKNLSHENQEIIRDHLKEIESWMMGMVPLKGSPCGSEQQLNQVARELTKVIMLVVLYEIPQNGYLNEQAKALYSDAMSLINSLQPFTQETEDFLIKRVKEIKKLQGGLGVSQEEKIQIVRAIGMAPGHWFKCPNGHYYVITECGGAMQEGKCNECKATIGGGSHRLRDDNQFAPEIDNATRPHYPAMAQRNLGGQYF